MCAALSERSSESRNLTIGRNGRWTRYGIDTSPQLHACFIDCPGRGITVLPTHGSYEGFGAEGKNREIRGIGLEHKRQPFLRPFS